MSITGAVGTATVNGLAYLGDWVVLSGRAIHAVAISPLQARKLGTARAIHSAMAVGVEALPIVSLITFFIGTIFALQSAYELRRFGALELTASAVAVSMTRELGPLMTAIVVIGRSGSAFAAEIGTMKVNEELDAMETMALEPVQFLVAPKFLAMVLMVPCLTCWADFMGVMGGGMFGVTSAGFTWGSYIQATLDAHILRDIITGLIKAAMFGLVITAGGCQEGFATGLGSEQVGRSTTSAVVKSIFLVVMVDLVFTTLFYITAPR